MASSANDAKMTLPVRVRTQGHRTRHPVLKIPFLFRELKLKEFRRLGCSDPGAHLWGTPHQPFRFQKFTNSRLRDLKDAKEARVSDTPLLEEQCPLDKNIDLYHKEIERHEQEEELLRTLCGERLPKELVLHVVKCKATGILPGLVLRDEDALPRTSRVLLGPDAPKQLLDLMESVVLDSVLIILKFKIPWVNRKLGEESTLATVPDFAVPLLPHVRTLVETIDIFAQGQYPVYLLRLIPRMPSFASQLTHVHLWRLEVSIEGQDRGALDAEYRASPAARRWFTYGMALEKLIEAVQAARPGRRQSLRMNFNGLGEVRSKLEEVVVDGRPAAELVAVAAGKEYVGGAATSRS
ncbi:hypothetical protein LTR10_011425 [Elasticomyces elasticus]|nr:hypothetical protein LTR10_011425 [Elasticomyces elasticus]KAK4966166.1 hypothetical protein LTR42_011326 [Elasticomyces elasticus]